MSIADPKRTLFTIVHCTDYQRDDVQQKRLEFMNGHLNHVESIMDKIIVAGPMFADDNATIVGSMFIYNTDNKEQALSYLKADPYYAADIWEKISINVFRGAIGDAVGGKAY